MATFAIQLGLAVAGTVLNALFAPTPPPQEGPRLNDLSVPSVNPGNPKNRVWGTMAIGTQIIWTSGLKETRHEEKVKGGKGGGKSQKVITYTYSADVALAIGDPVSRVRRIWANNKVLYSAILVTGEDASTVLSAADTAANLATMVNECYTATADGDKVKSSEKGYVRSILGTIEDQLVTIIAAMDLAGLPEAELDEAHDALTDYLDGLTPTMAQSGTTYVNKSAYEEAWMGMVTALEVVADDLSLAAKGSEDAYIDGEAAAQAEELAETEMPSNLTGLAAAAWQVKVSQGIVKKLKSTSNEDEEDSRYDRINIYTGTESQMPDDIMEAKEGVGKVPAYRGTSYFVVDELQLADFGNTIPTFKVEVENGTNGNTTLKEIVSSLCREAGLDATEYDVDGLPTTTIRGVARTRLAPPRETLEMIRRVYPFDVIESDYQVKFVARFRRPVARLRLKDLSAREQDADEPVKVKVQRSQDDELPHEINFKYQDPTRDFSISTARAKRAVVANNQVDEVDLTMNLHPTEAKTAVDIAMMDAYSQRRAYTLNLPIKYDILDPGDVVILPKRNAETADRRLVIVGMDLGANHLIEMSLTDYTEPNTGVVGLAYIQQAPVSAVQVSGPTEAYLLDLPILTDTEDYVTPGIYVGLAGPYDGWPGGALYVDSGSGGVTPLPGGGESEDDGQTSWEAIATSQLSVGHGSLVLPLAPASEHLWDRTNSIMVVMDNPHYVPSTISEATLLRGMSNTVVINGEIIQFATAIDYGNDTFELKDLLRGRRGTETFIQEHALNSDAVFITQANLKRYYHGASLLGITQDYKTASFNQDIAGVDDFAFTAQGISLKPLAPGGLSKELVGSDLKLTWLPRVRSGGLWQDGVDVTLDQASERYEIDIYDDMVLKRTLTVDGAREVLYLAADMTADFGGVPADGEMTIAVYQIGETIGRGFAKLIDL